MVEHKKTHIPSGKGSIWFWAGAAALSLGMAALVFTDSTLTVQADAPLARPAATLPPSTPPESLLPAAKPQAPVAFPPDALSGVATWYGAVLDGHRTASGERFDMLAMTAAHKSLPFGTLVRVVDLNTNRSVVVRINDRGELPGNHVIDLSYGAAKELHIVKAGVVPVSLEIVSLGTTGHRKH
jgi:rare lipoprotein A